MSETIVVTISADVASDKISVTVPDATSDLEVEIQPGGAGSIKLLVVKSSVYGEDLKYTINADATDHVLDEPHVLIGTGSVGLYGAEPTKLVFDNALGEEAKLQILVGRDATP